MSHQFYTRSRDKGWEPITGERACQIVDAMEDNPELAEDAQTKVAEVDVHVHVWPPVKGAIE